MVQLTWPHKDTDWAPILGEITAVYEEMAREIRKREPLLIVDEISHNDTWARDHGFITVEETTLDPMSKTQVLLDFKFNGWGEKFEATLDNEINRHLYEQGLVKGEYEDHLDFVLEGGSIESDGKGVRRSLGLCVGRRFDRERRQGYHLYYGVLSNGSSPQSAIDKKRD